jgi:hypothetical protein
LNQSDPTDNALAAIASILDNSEPAPTSVPAEQPPAPVAAPAPESAVEKPTDLDGYSKSGPGPLDAIRFRWTARRDSDGNYFVDETIGANSRPVTSGPMPKEDIVQFIDERERETRRRFDAIKSGMARGGDITAEQVHGEGDGER